MAMLLPATLNKVRDTHIRRHESRRGLVGKRREVREDMGA